MQNMQKYNDFQNPIFKKFIIFYAFIFFFDSKNIKNIAYDFLLFAKTIKKISTKIKNLLKFTQKNLHFQNILIFLCIYFFFESKNIFCIAYDFRLFLKTTNKKKSIFNKYTLLPFSHFLRFNFFYFTSYFIFFFIFIFFYFGKCFFFTTFKTFIFKIFSNFLCIYFFLKVKTFFALHTIFYFL